MLAEARTFFETMLLAVATLLPIVNPIAGASAFLAKTSDLTEADRQATAFRVARYGYMKMRSIRRTAPCSTASATARSASIDAPTSPTGS